MNIDDSGIVGEVKKSEPRVPYGKVIECFGFSLVITGTDQPDSDQSGGLKVTARLFATSRQANDWVSEKMKGWFE